MKVLTVLPPTEPRMLVRRRALGGLLAGAAAVGMFALAWPERALAADEGGGSGHGGGGSGAGESGGGHGGGESGGGRGAGRTPGERALRHRQRTGRTLGGGESGGHGGHTGGDSGGDTGGGGGSGGGDTGTGTVTTDGSTTGPIGGTTGGEHFVHPGIGDWSVRGRVLRKP